MERTGVERRLAAIVAADVAGYSRLMGADETGTLAALMTLRAGLIDPKIGEHHGRLVNTAGDGFLIEFGSAVDAVNYSVDLQEAIATRNVAIPEARQVRLRIGINVGDVMVEGDDLYGDGINVAARLEGLAEPGGICISRTARDQIRDKLPLQLEDLGEQEVKNIARPVRVFRILIGTGAGGSGASGATPAATAPALPDKPSIAVLPLENMSGDPEQEYFGDGIAEDILTALSKIEGLFVIARNSSFSYKGKSADVREMSRDLGVRYVVEGSVRKAGNRVRITAQLIDGETGGHVWAERYDGELTDIFGLQDEVTQKIVEALEVKLTAEQRDGLVHQGTANMEAYDCLLRGREQMVRSTRNASVEARALFERAIALDPDYAWAHAALAQAFLQTSIMVWTDDPAAALERAETLARKAIALDESLAAGHRVLGAVSLWQRRHDVALAEVERALELAPNDADCCDSLAGLCCFDGRPEQAIDAAQRSMRLNPHYMGLAPFSLGHAYFLLGRLDEAAAAFRDGIERNPNFMPNHLFLAAALGLVGDSETAEAAVAEARQRAPEMTAGMLVGRLPYADPADLERVLEGLAAAGLSS